MNARRNSSRLDEGRYTTIDFPGALQTEGEDINNRGQIVGTYYDASGTRHAFLRSANARLDRSPG